MMRRKFLKTEDCEKKGRALVGYGTGLYLSSNPRICIHVATATLAQLRLIFEDLGYYAFDKTKVQRVAIFAHPKTKP